MKFTYMKFILIYAGVKARTLLAALDWNSKVREPATDSQGHNIYDTVYSKRQKKWVCRLPKTANTRPTYVAEENTGCE